jgi:hypothetical protein
MNAIITSQTPVENRSANLDYSSRTITEKETVDWLLTNQSRIIPPHLFDFFIDILTDETKRSASRMVAMNKLKQQLLTLQRQQPQQQQPPVVGGGSRRRANKHSNKSRKSRKYRKSRRH